MTTHWLITDKGDPEALALVDGVSFGGAPHYSRQTPGARSFTRNGQNLVFITSDARAVWVSFRPTPGIAVRTDGLECWENALFRTEGHAEKASTLIREATELTWALWGTAPRDGLITFVKPERVRSALPGYCYRRAGWRRVGYSGKGFPMFRAPRPACVRPYTAWKWKPSRGGLLRRIEEEHLR